MSSVVETKVLNLGLVPLVRWWKNGDHPGDDVGKMEPDPASAADDSGEVGTYRRQEGRIVRYFRRPWDVPTGARVLCGKCGGEMERHGWVDSGGAGRTVCPGDWVVVSEMPDDAYVFTDAQLQVLAPDDIAIAISRAQETADAIDDALAENVGAVACVVQGLARAAAGALEQARDLAAGGGMETS